MGGTGGVVRDHRHRGTSTGSTGWYPYPYGLGGIAVGIPIADCVEDPEDPDLCLDERVIVGHPNGPSYGGWAAPMKLPHTFVDAGMTTRRFGDPLAGKMVLSRDGSNSVSGIAGAHDHAAAGVFRVGFSGRHLYGGGEFEIGSLTTAPAVTGSQAGGDAMAPSTAVMFGYAALAGYAAKAGPVHVGVEGVAGGRTISYNFGAFSADATVAVVEARVRGELWLTPWVAAGAMLGSSVIRRDDWMGGLYLSVHTRAFGGL